MLTDLEKETIINAFCEKGVNDIWRHSQDRWDDENRKWISDGKCLIEKHYSSGSLYTLNELGRVDNRSAMDFIQRLREEKKEAYKKYFL